MRENPEHLAILEGWMRSYRPQELFTADGALASDLAALPPKGPRRLSANPHANGHGSRPLRLPELAPLAVEVPAPGGLILRPRVGNRVRSPCQYPKSEKGS